MNQKIPRTPFSTGLSRSARETEIRIRNIMSGPKRRPPLPLLILMFSIAIFCGNIVSCQMKEPADPDSSSVSSSSSSQGDPADSGSEAQTQRAKEMVADHYQKEYPYPVYLAENAPEEPQENDRRLDSVSLLAEHTLDGQRYGLYEVQHSSYYCSQQTGPMEWHPTDSPTLFLLRLEDSGEPAEVLSSPNFYTGGLDPQDIIRQIVWQLLDLEVCLFRDGYSTPIGPGNWTELFPEFEPEISIFQEGEPIYQPGDYWDNWSIDGGGDAGGVSALRYYNAAEGSWSVNRLETGRTDMVTPRGIRVGATRDEVLAAYPGLLSDEKDWSWAYPDDYLCYCADENGFGPHLYFFFVDDVVYMIQMVNMFD